MRPRSATAPTARATLEVLFSYFWVSERAFACRDVRDGSKHALVYAKEEIGNTWASDRRRTQDVHEAKVIERADVLSRLVGKGERVAPEEPLE